MELGPVPYRCQGINALYGAVHPDNGFVWTDSKGIFLSPLQLFQGQVENQEHNKLGEFDRGVKSVYWGDNVADGLCYMCVVHDKNISIWKVEGHQPKLAFKQVRKVNIQPIQQGCLWNPGRDILCVLCPQQASLYYSHLKNKGSQVLLHIDRDKIHCGCWLTDGSRLVICIGTSLSIYHWSDIDESITQCSYISWTVPRQTGSIISVVPVSETRLVYVAELPLETLCKTQDTFLLPDLLHTNSTNNNLTDSLKDGEIIKPKGKENSVTEALFNIPRNPDAVIEDSSRLECIQLHDDKDPQKLTGCNVKGILTPDILLYQAEEQLIIVGSNTQPLLQVFAYDNQQLSKCSEICIDKHERPKGVACYPQGQQGSEPGVLVLIGKKELSDSAFPSSTNTVIMKSVLKFFNLKQGRYGKNPLTHTKSAPSIPLSVAANGHHDSSVDYDLITQKVINFDTNITRSVDNLNRNGNNNKARTENKAGRQELGAKYTSEDIKRTQSEVKPNGNHGNHVSIGERHMSDPPKRPVRKKKSVRGQQDLGEKTSGSGQISQKPLMEYQSDSSEASPRVAPPKPRPPKVGNTPVLDIGADLSSASKNVSESDTVSQSHSNRKEDSDIDMSSERAKLERQRRLLSDSSKSPTPEEKSSTELKLEPVTFISDEFSREITLSLSKDTNKVLTNGIVELDETDSSRELETDKANFDTHARNFKAYDNRNFQETAELAEANIHRYLNEKAASTKIQPEHAESSVSSSKDGHEQLSEARPLQNVQKHSVSLESLEDIDRLLKEQNDKISKLQAQMSALSQRVDQSVCVLPSRYHSVNKPDIVHVIFRCKDGVEIRRKFLLDGGRLQLDQIKQAFSLETVEIYIDDEPCVTGCNIDGYIPLRFESNSVIYISGKPAL